MSTFIFNIACPRCDTMIKIYQDTREYNCSRCQFKVVIKDKDNLILAFKNKEVEDLDFTESPIRDPNSMIDTGIEISFSKASDNSDADEKDDNKADNEVDEDKFGNKTANTQIIQVTFDPAKYLEEMKHTSAKQKKMNKKISLKKIIHNAESAKPPLPSSSEKLKIKILAVTIIILIIAIILAVIYK